MTTKTHKQLAQLDLKISDLLVFILTLLTLGCEIPERPQIINISEAPDYRPKIPEDVQTVEAAMASVITVCRDDLTLPVLDSLSVHLYKNSASLAEYAFGRRIIPTDVENLTAFSRYNEIHVNLKATKEASWGVMVPVLAHEYAHNIHYSLTTNVPRFPIWLTEGFATWVAARTLHSLGWQNYETSLRAAKRELIRHRDSFSDLAWLNNARDWKAIAEKRNGWVRTYTVAFVATHNLIERAGLSAMVSYLKSENFEASFHSSSARFLSDFQALSLSITPEKMASFAFPKPAWKIGYQWIYEETRPGSKATVRKRIVKEAVLKDVPTFVVSTDDEDYFYSKKSLALVATMKKGNLTSSRDSPNEFFAWPLEPGKEWRNAFVLQDVETRNSRRIDRSMVVTNLEQIEVPAGVFTALKIESYDNNSGRLHAEIWYAPKVKWIVKSITYQAGDGFGREEQLVSFNAE